MESFRMATLVNIVFTLSLVAATPQIRNVKAIQLYPWDTKVHISFEVVGDITPEASLMISAKDKTSAKTYTASGDYLSGDTGTAEGQHKIVWDIGAQGVSLNSTNVTFIVGYYSPYLVIDLSSGASSASYPVTYMGEPPSGGFNTDEYKTTKLVLRLIKPGSFKMNGSYKTTLTKPFYCGIFEVTQKQYELVMGNNPSSYKGDMRPVECVSWNNIRGDSSTYNWPSSANVDPSTFMGRIQARTGLKFDLPTEAQWEYACRAGTTSAYNNGGDTENDLKKLGRCSGNTADGKGGYTDAHTKVGSYQPNAWGLYDMHGNVWEWCLDCYGGLSSGVVDPVGSSSGSYRVYRGGSWNSYFAIYCTSSSRNSLTPSYENGSSGFRLVRTLSE